MRYLILAVAFAVVSGPALAREHSHSAHAVSYRHHRAHEARQAAPWSASSWSAPAAPKPASGVAWRDGGDAAALAGMAAAQASANGVPVSLVDRVIKRESGGNPRAVSRGNYGLMQIRLNTARAMGYAGSAAGLLDAQTNMTYAVRYLAGAYRAAGGNESRAVALYARGYYGVAKAQGFSPYGGNARGDSTSYTSASIVPATDGWVPVYRVRHRAHHAV